MGYSPYVIIWDGTYKGEVDSQGYLVSIDIAHHKVHEGNHYFVGDTDTINAAATKYWHIAAPDTAKRIHFVMEVMTSNSGLLEFYVQPTLTGNGTGLTCFNSDGNSSNTTTLLIYKDPTVTGDGTLIAPYAIGSNGGANKFGGQIRSGAEVILKQNYHYLAKFTADNNNTRVSFIAEFYEV